MDNVEMERAIKQGAEALRIQKIQNILKWGYTDPVKKDENEGLDHQMRAMDRLLVKQLEEARNAVAAAKSLLLARRPWIVEGCRCGSGKAVVNVGMSEDDWNLIQSLHCMCPGCGAPYADLGKCEDCKHWCMQGHLCGCRANFSTLEENKIYVCTPGALLDQGTFDYLKDNYPHLDWSHSTPIEPSTDSMDFF